jgi:rubrerythrin
MRYTHVLSYAGGFPMSTFVARTREQSLHNLRIAFNAESNAVARYRAYAMQADEEGYGRAASLFRAVARSEEIHAANHATALRQIGGKARPAIEGFELKRTAENLKAAVAGETYEFKQMYPELLRDAEAAMLLSARRSFRFALLCEMEHARLFQALLERIERGEEESGSQAGQCSAYYVCPGCGFTVEDVGIAECAICGQSRQDSE